MSRTNIHKILCPEILVVFK